AEAPAGVPRSHRLSGPPRARQSGHPSARHLPLGRGTPQRDPGRRHRRREKLRGLRPSAPSLPQGLSRLYRRASRLFHELLLARADGTYVRVLTKLARFDVLVIDDWGLAPVQEQERRDLLEILEDRYGTRSTIVTSQLPPAQWHEHIGDATLADAIRDRPLHHAHGPRGRDAARRPRAPEHRPHQEPGLLEAAQVAAAAREGFLPGASPAGSTRARGDRRALWRVAGAAAD